MRKQRNRKFAFLSHFVSTECVLILVLQSESHLDHARSSPQPLATMTSHSHS